MMTNRRVVGTVSAVDSLSARIAKSCYYAR